MYEKNTQRQSSLHADILVTFMHLLPLISLLCPQKPGLTHFWKFCFKFWSYR